MRLLQEVGWVLCWIPYLVGSGVDEYTGGSCEAGGSDESSDCIEPVNCGESSNCWEFGDCGWPGGGETGRVGEADGGGEPVSRSTLKWKFSRMDYCLQRINCEDWYFSFKIYSEHGLLFSLLVHGISCELLLRSGDIGVGLFWFSQKLFFDSFAVFLIPLKNISSW